MSKDYRLVKETRLSGDVIYSIEELDGETWRFVSGTATAYASKAREAFENLARGDSPRKEILASTVKEPQP